MLDQNENAGRVELSDKAVESRLNEFAKAIPGEYLHWYSYKTYGDAVIKWSAPATNEKEQYENIKRQVENDNKEYQKIPWSFRKFFTKISWWWWLTLGEGALMQAWLNTQDFFKELSSQMPLIRNYLSIKNYGDLSMSLNRLIPNGSLLSKAKDAVKFLNKTANSFKKIIRRQAKQFPDSLLSMDEQDEIPQESEEKIQLSEKDLQNRWIRLCGFYGFSDPRAVSFQELHDKAKSLLDETTKIRDALQNTFPPSRDQLHNDYSESDQQIFSNISLTLEVNLNSLNTIIKTLDVQLKDLIEFFPPGKLLEGKNLPPNFTKLYNSGKDKYECNCSYLIFKDVLSKHLPNSSAQYEIDFINYLTGYRLGERIGETWPSPSYIIDPLSIINEPLKKQLIDRIYRKNFVLCSPDKFPDALKAEKSDKFVNINNEKEDLLKICGIANNTDKTIAWDWSLLLGFVHDSRTLISIHQIIQIKMCNLLSDGIDFWIATPMSLPLSMEIFNNGFLSSIFNELGAVDFAKLFPAVKQDNILAKKLMAIKNTIVDRIVQNINVYNEDKLPTDDFIQQIEKSPKTKDLLLKALSDALNLTIYLNEEVLSTKVNPKATIHLSYDANTGVFNSSNRNSQANVPLSANPNGHFAEQNKEEKSKANNSPSIQQQSIPQNPPNPNPTP
jgi:hypothetical protein